MKSGMTVLEEFLQEKYVENFDNFTSDDSNKVAKLSALYQSYFYNPQEDGYGTVNYVLDAEGHALYLINKAGLPQEIRENLNGGNCGAGKTGPDRYREYTSLVDVYGVTSDLIVYYSAGDGSFMGISSTNELDNDTTSRVLLAASDPLTATIKKDGTALTVADMQSVKNLIIDSASGITNFSNLYVLSSLKELIIENKTLENLDGIEAAPSLNYVYFKESQIGNYSALSKVSKLRHLYNYGIDDVELIKLCNGIRTANFPDLEYFGISGEAIFLGDGGSSGKVSYERTSEKYITNLLPIGTLESSCIGNVKYLQLHSNEITDTLNEDGTVAKYALENISLMTNLIGLRVERNKLTSLKGLKNMTNLKYVIAAVNKLGDYEVYDPSVHIYDEEDETLEVTTDIDRGKNTETDALADLDGKKIKIIILKNNRNLKWVGYLSSATSMERIEFGDGSSSSDCLNMVDGEVTKIRDVIVGCGSNKTIPGKYWLSLLSKTDKNLEIPLGSAQITRSQFMSLTGYPNAKYINLKNVKIYENYEDESKTYSNLIQSQESINPLVTSVLKELKNLKYVNLGADSKSSLVNFNDLTFIKGADLEDSKDDLDLIEFCVIGTKVSTKKNVSNNWESYENGLKLLNTRIDPTNTNSDFYCKSLNVLAVSEAHIDLGDIPDVVKRCCSQTKYSYFERNADSLHGCLWASNDKVFETFKNVSGLEKLYIAGGGSSGTAYLDLSEMTTLKEFSNRGSFLCGSVKLPYSCTAIIETNHIRGAVDFSEITGDLPNLSFGASGKEQLINSLSTIAPSSTISCLRVRWGKLVGTQDESFDIFTTIYNKRGCNLKLKKITTDQAATSATLKSMDGFQYIDGLEYLSITGCSFSGLGDISALNKFSDTLTYLELPNFAISNASILRNFSKLTYLNLENNSLAPYVEIDKLDVNGNVVMENGQPVKERWWTIEGICSRMRENVPVGNVRLATVRLANNSSISDWTGFTSDITEFSFTKNYMSTYGNDS